MELFLSPLSCSLAAHVACLEAGLPVTLRPLDRLSKRLDDGSDYTAVAPLGLVPALRLDDGSLVTEMAAVLQYIADRAPSSGLAPGWGTPERYRLVAWVHFVSTEMHKKHLWMIYSPKTPEAVKDWARSSAGETLDFVARELEGKAFVMGDSFTVADAYLFWALMVFPHGGISLSRWPALEAYAARVRERPSVKAALGVEYPLFQREQAQRAAAAAGGAPAGEGAPRPAGV